MFIIMILESHESVHLYDHLENAFENMCMNYWELKVIINTVQSQLNRASNSNIAIISWYNSCQTSNTWYGVLDGSKAIVSIWEHLIDTIHCLLHTSTQYCTLYTGMIYNRALLHQRTFITLHAMPCNSI